MSLLANVKSDDSIVQDKDILGYGDLLESGIYKSTITMAYITQSAGGALGVVCDFKTEDGTNFRDTFWVASGNAKGNVNYYMKDGTKHYLPGYTVANNMALLTEGKELNEISTEQKIVKVYSKEAGGEVPTEVEALTPLIGKEVYAAVVRRTVNKSVKGDDGKYVDINESRDENIIDKFFRAKDKMTVAEIRAQAETAEFFTAWSDKNTGVTQNRFKPVAASGAAGATANAITGNKPTTSLFTGSTASAA